MRGGGRKKKRERRKKERDLTALSTLKGRGGVHRSRSSLLPLGKKGEKKGGGEEEEACFLRPTREKKEKKKFREAFSRISLLGEEGEGKKGKNQIILFSQGGRKKRWKGTTALDHFAGSIGEKGGKGGLFCPALLTYSYYGKGGKEGKFDQLACPSAVAGQKGGEGKERKVLDEARPPGAEKKKKGKREKKAEARRAHRS